MRFQSLPSLRRRRTACHASRPLRTEILESRIVLAASALFSVVNDWGSGFQGQIGLTNGTTATASWQLEFDYAGNISEIWDAQIVSHAGNHYVLRNASWNGALEPNETTTFGFLAQPGNPTSGPTNYVFNGTPLGGNPSWPNLSIADVTVNEPITGSATASFVVTLSAASTSPVTLNYATSNGTATAGTDYTAASGSLAFAPGQTSKTIQVSVLKDVLDEANETFAVTLSNVTGANVARGVAQGTIIDDDPAPTVSIADAVGAEPAAGVGVASGFLHTSGNQILNAANQSVRIAGVSWFGIESDTFSPHGLWTRNWKSMMDQMVAEGFNAIRLPYSNQAFDAGSVPNGIDFHLNPDLVGLDSLGIIDKIVDYAGDIGLRVMLDHHRSDAGASANENGLWYTAAYPESRWISDWVMLATRYAGNATVIGADIHNEPHDGANWGQGGANDWRLAAERAGNAILAVNPDWLIVVEGVQNASSGSYWWGGNLSNAGDFPVRLNVPGRLVYSPHSYPKSVYPQTWFDDPNYPDNLPSVWDRNWGYLFREGIAPILLGEFGTKLATTSDQLWLDKMVDYLGGDLDGNGRSDLAAGQLGPSWTYWSWNPNSSDTGGILNADWNTVARAKVNALTPIQFDFPDAVANATNNVSVTVTLSAVSGQTVTVAYATAGGTATSGVDFQHVAGTITFAPGQTSKTIVVPIYGDNLIEPNETLRVNIVSVTNATAANPFATVTIVDHQGQSGDANADGVIDGADYTVWADHFLQSTSQGPSAGDFNRDGIVDAGDYSIWADNFSQASAVAAVALVDEETPAPGSPVGMSRALPTATEQIARSRTGEEKRAVLSYAATVDAWLQRLAERGESERDWQFVRLARARERR